jgi:hypothetical protein
MQIELELNFDAWRDYQSNKSLSSSARRMLLARWADMSWGILRTQVAFIRKCFEATILIMKDGSHRLHMKRLSRPYKPIFL